MGRAMFPRHRIFSASAQADFAFTLLSVFASDRTRASGLAIAMWFFFVLVFDLLLLGALVVTGGQWGGEIFPYLLLANPADVFRILNVFALDDVRTLYGLTTVFPPTLATSVMRKVSNHAIYRCFSIMQIRSEV